MNTSQTPRRSNSGLQAAHVKRPETATNTHVWAQETEWYSAGGSGQGRGGLPRTLSEAGSVSHRTPTLSQLVSLLRLLCSRRQAAGPPGTTAPDSQSSGVRSFPPAEEQLQPPRMHRHAPKPPWMHGHAPKPPWMHGHAPKPLWTHGHALKPPWTRGHAAKPPWTHGHACQISATRQSHRPVPGPTASRAIGNHIILSSGRRHARPGRDDPVAQRAPGRECSRGGQPTPATFTRKEHPATVMARILPTPQICVLKP